MLPDERLEFLLANIAALLANQWRGEDDTPVTPRDFLPWLPEDDGDEQSTDMVAMIEHLNALFGGEDLRHEQGLAVEIARRAKELIDADREDEFGEDHEEWEP